MEMGKRKGREERRFLYGNKGEGQKGQQRNGGRRPKLGQAQRQLMALPGRAALSEHWGGTSLTQGHVQPVQLQKEVNGRTEVPQHRTQSTKDQRGNRKRGKRSSFAAACRALIATRVRTGHWLCRERMHVNPKEYKIKKLKRNVVLGVNFILLKQQRNHASTQPHKHGPTSPLRACASHWG